MSITELETRVRRLEDRHEIEALAIRYGIFFDDRDLEGFKTIWAPQGTLRTKSGQVKGEGPEGAAQYARDRYRVLGPTNHFVHGHLIDFIDADRATGHVSSHAEVSRDGVTALTAIRYLDRYVRLDGRWLIEDRVQSYMYFLTAEEYAARFGEKLRFRGPDGAMKSGDWPEWFA